MGRRIRAAILHEPDGPISYEEYQSLKQKLDETEMRAAATYVIVLLIAVLGSATLCCYFLITRID